jgi:16S rRNA (cytidine1402-2'-O)-methyltransferase
MNGILYLIPTPVGNLEDMTIRAIRLLKEVDYVLAEDTRTSGILLKHYEISNQLRSYHQHNEHGTVERIVADLLQGQQVALITDAGTPGISDPGYLLAKVCIENNIEVQCLPGATAFVPALCVSGLPSHDFVFAGFLPPKKGRQTRMMELAALKRTVIIYESPHKIVKCMDQIKAFFGPNAQVSLSREISKKFEETLRGTAEELIEILKTRTLKGEMVVVINNNID